jgi:hypothetical protein
LSTTNDGSRYNGTNVLVVHYCHRMYTISMELAQTVLYVIFGIAFLWIVLTMVEMFIEDVLL